MADVDGFGGNESALWSDTSVEIGRGTGTVTGGQSAVTAGVTVVEVARRQETGTVVKYANAG